MTSAAAVPLKAMVETQDRAETLVLVNLSGEPVDAWLDAMCEAGQPWHPQVVESLNEARALLDAEPGAYALLCHDAPEAQVARELGLGRAPSQALANWQNLVEPLLTLYREHYQRITLVEPQALYQTPKALAEQLAKRSGIALGRVKVAALNAEMSPQAEWQQATQRLLALQALSHGPARRLAEELQASSLPLQESEAMLDQLDDLFDLHHAALQATPKITIEDYRELVSERDRLQGEQAGWQKEQQRLQAEYDALKDQQASQERDKAQTKAASEKQQALQAKVDDLQEENDLIIEQLHKVQEELEQYILGHKGNSTQVAKLERDITRKNEKLHAFSQKNKRLVAQLQEARQQLKALKASKSWKVTAPMRKLVRLLGGGKQGAK